MWVMFAHVVGCCGWLSGDCYMAVHFETAVFVTPYNARRIFSIFFHPRNENRRSDQLEVTTFRSKSIIAKLTVYKGLFLIILFLILTASITQENLSLFGHSL